MGQGVLRQLLEQNPGLDGDGEVLQVIVQDAVHPGGDQHHPAVQRDAAPHQARAGAPGGDGDVVVVAQLHHGSSLLRGEDFHRRLRHVDAVDGHFVPPVVGVYVLAGGNPAGGDGLQLGKDLLGDRFIGCHSGRPPLRMKTSRQGCALPGMVSGCILSWENGTQAFWHRMQILSIR